MELNKKDKKKWIVEHSQEIFRDRQRGISLAALIKKYKTTDYYIYAAIYVQGGEEAVPKYLLKYIKNSFRGMTAKKSLELGPIRRTASDLDEERLRRSALDHADQIVTDFNLGLTRSQLRVKYKMSDYYILGALYHRGVKIPSSDKRHFANWKLKGEPLHEALAASGVCNLNRITPADDLATKFKEEGSLVQRQDTEIKRLRAEVDMWKEECERLAPFEKKHADLLKAYNDKLAAEVAAEETLAHRS